MLSTPILSQAAIYRLQQLAGAVHRQTGVRHKLSKPDQLMALLRFASQATQPEVALHYRAFFSLLTREQRRRLEQDALFAAGSASVEPLSSHQTG